MKGSSGVLNSTMDRKMSTSSQVCPPGSKFLTSFAKGLCKYTSESYSAIGGVVEQTEKCSGPFSNILREFGLSLAIFAQCFALKVLKHPQTDSKLN